jgi:hypothetical protein
VRPVAILATIAILSMLPAAAHAAFPGTNGKLAFGSARSGYPADNDLYSMDGNGTAITRITSLNQDELNPAWAPSGTKVAFERVTGFRADIWSATSAGGNPTRLTTDPRNDLWPAWDRTGTKIVFSSDRGNTEGVFDLYVMNANGSNQVNITNTPSISEEYPAWSPDGTAIAFSGNGDLYKQPPFAGQTATIIGPPTPAIELEPDWSPDSSQIVYRQGINTHDELWRINADGGGRAILTRNSSVVEQKPVWSPQGDKIAFIRGMFNTAEVFTMNPDGTGETQITSTTTDMLVSGLSWGVSPSSEPPPPPAPITTISSKPPAQTQSTSARFEFAANQQGATFMCRLDGTPTPSCSSPQNYGNLSVGQHTFEVTAIGSTGIEGSPVSWTWTVTAPTTPTTPTTPPAPPAAPQAPASGPSTVTDSAAPTAKLKYSKRQRIENLWLVVQVSEAGTIRVVGSVARAGASKTYRSRTVRRRVKADVQIKVRLKLSKKSIRAVKRALKRKRLKATVTVRATDDAGNRKTARARITLKR